MTEDINIRVEVTPGDRQKTAHDLASFMKSAHEEIAREYQRIRQRASEDPGTAGDQGEENWAALLREWLPPMYPVVTKGRILSSSGTASPQVDILVLHPTYPKRLLDKKLYLAGGVVAAFECKTTLRLEHISQAVRNAAEIRKHVGKPKGTPYQEMSSSLMYGLLAHSYAQRSKKKSIEDSIVKKLEEADLRYITHPREMLDVVCIANIGSWSTLKMPWMKLPMPLEMTEPLAEMLSKILEGSAVTAYVCYSNVHNRTDESFTPIGILVSELMRKLAWEDRSLRRLAVYFLLSQGLGSGTGRVRQWELDIFSDQVRAEIVKWPYETRNIQLGHGDDSLWDEWRGLF